MNSLAIITVCTRCANFILGNLASYAHALSSVERALGHFLWDPDPINVSISRQKNDFVVYVWLVTLFSGGKKIGCMTRQ